MTTHGKYCDFDFYVTSLDAENGCAATEPMSSGLSLLEAVSEFYKRCGRYPSNTNIMLGVEYTTSRRDLEPAGKGAADLLQRVNGHLHISKDYEQSAVLSQEGLIANNAVSFLTQQSERFYEISDKYTAECAKFISDNLPEITDDPEKLSEALLAKKKIALLTRDNVAEDRNTIFMLKDKKLAIEVDFSLEDVLKRLEDFNPKFNRYDLKNDYKKIGDILLSQIGV